MLKLHSRAIDLIERFDVGLGAGRARKAEFTQRGSPSDLDRDLINDFE
jgi:hypothetical protein